MLVRREKTHGDYGTNAAVSQAIKAAVHGSPRWAKMTAAQRESLDLIATKIGRICSGDPNEKDHWLDISGYAELAVKSIR